MGVGVPNPSFLDALLGVSQGAGTSQIRAGLRELRRDKPDKPQHSSDLHGHWADPSNMAGAQSTRWGVQPSLTGSLGI